MAQPLANFDKGGPLDIQGTPVCLTNAGSQVCASQVSKFEALFNVLGHSIARFPCGRTVQVTPGALVDISFHGAINA